MADIHAKTLDVVCTNSLRALHNHTPESEEYARLLDQSVKLHKMKTETQPRRPSPDTLILVAANILGILLVTRYERENIVTSKAFGLILKPR